MTERPPISSFERLVNREHIRGELVAVTALRVGAGKSFDVAATDQPILRDARGQPFIPGSSLKGALRSALERILQGLDAGTLDACDIFDDDHRCTAKLEAKRKKDKEEGKSEDISFEDIRDTTCMVCGLFGSSLLAGRLFVHDLPVVDEEARSEIRDGVGIHRDLRTAQEGIKYDLEAVSPGTRFRLDLTLENANEVQVALTLKLLDLLDEGEVLLGGLTSRGLGRVRLDKLEIQHTDAAQLLGIRDAPVRVEGETWKEKVDWAEKKLMACLDGPT